MSTANTVLAATQTTVFNNLFEAIKAEENGYLQKSIEEINAHTDVWSLKSYYNHLFTPAKKRMVWDIADLKIYLIERKTKEHNKEIEKQLQHLIEVEKAPELVSIRISIDWAKSRMWGMNPTAEAWISTTKNSNYVKSGSISGCGYDKESTAFAEAVNQDYSLLKALYNIKNNNVDIKNRELFGYGAGYGILPRLEGGVGTSSFYAIFKTLGFKMTKTASGKTYDAYQIEKAPQA